MSDIVTDEVLKRSTEAALAAWKDGLRWPGIASAALEASGLPEMVKKAKTFTQNRADSAAYWQTAADEQNARATAAERRLQEAEKLLHRAKIHFAAKSPLGADIDSFLNTEAGNGTE